MKRIYETVTVIAGTDGFQVMLDDRPLRSPGQRPLILRHRALADAVAAEWRDQGGAIESLTMPMMSLAATASDRVAPCRAFVIDAITSYGETDLLCYRADQPDDLVRLQNRTWQPLLDWCEKVIEAPFRVTAGIMPLRQPAAAVAAIRRQVACYDDLPMTGLYELAAGSGSVVIALAVTEGRIGVEEGIEAALLDEDYQIQRWGEDAEAASRRRSLCRDMRAAARFLQYCRILN